MSKHIDLLPVQQQFVDSDAQIVGFLADRAAGKTTAGAVKAIKKILQGESGVIVGHNFAHMAHVMFPEFERLLPEQLSLHLGCDHPWTAHKRMKFKVCDKIVNVYYGKIGGQAWRSLDDISWLWLDEVLGVRRCDFDSLHRRILRSEHSQAWITSFDPREENHWLNSIFRRGPVPRGQTDRSMRVEGGRVLSECFPVEPQYNLTNVSSEHRALIEELYPALAQDLGRTGRV